VARRVGLSHRLLDPVPLTLLSQQHSIGRSSPKRYGNRYEQEALERCLKIFSGNFAEHPFHAFGDYTSERRRKRLLTTAVSRRIPASDNRMPITPSPRVAPGGGGPTWDPMKVLGVNRQLGLPG